MLNINTTDVAAFIVSTADLDLLRTIQKAAHDKIVSVAASLDVAPHLIASTGPLELKHSLSHSINVRSIFNWIASIPDTLEGITEGSREYDAHMAAIRSLAELYCSTVSRVGTTIKFSRVDTPAAPVPSVVPAEPTAPVEPEPAAPVEPEANNTPTA